MFARKIMGTIHSKERERGGLLISSISREGFNPEHYCRYPSIHALKDTNNYLQPLLLSVGSMFWQYLWIRKIHTHICF